MSYVFPERGAIVVRVRAAGTFRVALERFSLDTGAERTCIPPDMANLLGLTPISAGTIWTASELVRVTEVVVPRFDALGQTRRNFRVLVHPLPAGAPIKGLLGLDFFRDTRLTIDFRTQTVTVS